MAVVMRALVMLLILVGLPTAWVYYGPLPPRAQRVADRVVEVAQDALGWEQQPLLAEELIAAPRYDTNLSAETPLVAAASVAGENLESQGGSQIEKRVEPTLARLRELGVSEYSLEKWGNAGQMYRFRCAMPLSQNDEVTRQFEAVTDNPKASIEQVVGEVYRWQSARQGQELLR